MYAASSSVPSSRIDPLSGAMQETIVRGHTLAAKALLTPNDDIAKAITSEVTVNLKGIRGEPKRP